MVPLDKKLYTEVKRDADKKFIAPTSVYKSAWIVREYKKRGGRFADEKNPTQGLLRWFKEKWVDLNRNNMPCGRKKAAIDGTYPLCRPTVKVTTETPKLAKDIPQKTIKAANKKKQQVKNKGSVSF